MSDKIKVLGYMDGDPNQLQDFGWEPVRLPTMNGKQWQETMELLGGSAQVHILQLERADDGFAAQILLSPQAAQLTRQQCGDYK